MLVASGACVDISHMGLVIVVLAVFRFLIDVQGAFPPIDQGYPPMARCQDHRSCLATGHNSSWPTYYVRQTTTKCTKRL